MNKLPMVILDRDGVINHDSPNYIKSPEEWVAIEGSLEAIAKLNQLNIRVYIASNQSGIARNLFDYAMLNAIYRKMTEELRNVGGHINSVAFQFGFSDHNGQAMFQPTQLFQRFRLL